MAEALLRAPARDETCAPEPQVDLLVEADGWGCGTGPLCAMAGRAAHAALASQRTGAARTELTVVLANDAAVHALNREWRGKDAPTNVLAFPACTPQEIAADAQSGMPLLLGDVVLALETCVAEADAAGIAAADHVAHLVVHGVLHLFGHDHGTDPEAERMEALEVAVLASMGISNPYDTSLQAEENGQ